MALNYYPLWFFISSAIRIHTRGWMMAQQVRNTRYFAKDISRIQVGQLTTTLKSSSEGSHVPFWLLGISAHIWHSSIHTGTQLHMNKNDKNTSRGWKDAQRWGAPTVLQSPKSGGSQPPLIPVSRDLIHYSDLLKHQAHTWKDAAETGKLNESLYLRKSFSNQRCS